MNQGASISTKSATACRSGQEQHKGTTGEHSPLLSLEEQISLLSPQSDL